MLSQQEMDHRGALLVVEELRAQFTGSPVMTAERAAEVVQEWTGQRKPQSAAFGPPLGDLRVANACNCYYRALGLPEVPVPGDGVRLSRAFDDNEDEKHHREAVEVHESRNRPLWQGPVVNSMSLESLVHRAENVLATMPESELRAALEEHARACWNRLIKNEVIVNAVRDQAKREHEDRREEERMVTRLRQLLDKAERGHIR
jgi:hypothetical protein